MLQEENRLKDDVFTAAMEWFASLRPKDYPLERHYANPTINTKTDAEAELAGAIGRFLRGRLSTLRDHDL